MIPSQPVPLLISLLLLTGCASISVRQEQAAKAAPAKRPQLIHVEPFSTRKAEFNVDREGAELEAFKIGTAEMLALKLEERLVEIAPVKRLVKKRRPREGWLVTGQFVRVNQGSRALRTVLGFGLGATKMETDVQIFDLGSGSSKPFLTFHTTGGSNAEPGAIANLGPVTALTGIGLLVGGLGNAAHGISEDAWRTSRVIRDKLLMYSQEKGIVPKTPPIKSSST